MRGLLARWRRAAPVAAVTPEDPGLVVLVQSFDPAASDVAVVEAALASDGEAALDPARPVLVRHHLAGLDDPQALVGGGALDASYSLVVEPGVGGDGDRVLVVRSEPLDALSITRERTRMAGLAQRLGGRALGWDVLQAPGEPGAPGSAGTAGDGALGSRA